MNTHVLHKSADKNRFFEICDLFEKNLPDFKRLLPFEDKRQGALFVRFERGSYAVVICLETLWQERIIAKTNFDISTIIEKGELFQ